jgi:hypothetical protein
VPCSRLYLSMLALASRPLTGADPSSRYVRRPPPVEEHGAVQVLIARLPPAALEHLATIGRHTAGRLARARHRAAGSGVTSGRTDHSAPPTTCLRQQDMAFTLPERVRSSSRHPRPRAGPESHGASAMTARMTSIIGSVFYLLWAALHLQAGYGVIKLGASIPASMIQGRLYQDAWTLLAAAVAVAIVSLIMLSRSWPLGYWLNLGIAGITDVGFIAFVLIPGYAPLWPGLQGPLAWIFGLSFSTIGFILTRRAKTQHRGAHTVDSGSRQ